MKEYPSIFNQALAPITPGPSSSNTCGPVRIGYTCYQILGRETPAEASIQYALDGAFPTTLFGMRSDIAFINGLLGRQQNDPDFMNAYANAEKAGLKVTFGTVPTLPTSCLEAVAMTFTMRDGAVWTAFGESNGGGTFTIRWINGIEVGIRGDQYELLVYSGLRDGRMLEDLKRRVLAVVGETYNSAAFHTGPDGAILEVKSGRAYPAECLDEVRKLAEVTRAGTVDPVHPEVRDARRHPPFETPEGLVAYCAGGKGLYEAALDYEMAVSGWTEEEIRRYAGELLKIMDEGRASGFRPGVDMNGIVAAKACELNGNFGRGRQLNLGFLNQAVPISLSIMEHSNASGKIVCVPTGGSSGIVPGALFAAAGQLEERDEALYRGLMAAGLIGVLMSTDGNEFNGGECGCQAEIACGTAMAAGGLVEMMGGSAQQACDAASLCLQSFMGLICDPVAGLVQVPCLARNMSGVAVAAVSANAVMSGFDAVLPFSEVTHTMISIGRRMVSALGACCSGCCETPTAVRLTKEQEEQNAKLRHG